MHQTARKTAHPNAPGLVADALMQATHQEERWRDAALWLLLRWIPPWVTPDHLSALRLLLAGGSVVLWAAGVPLRVVVWVMAGAAVTDFIDGPLARRRGSISASGAQLDQVSDAVLGAGLGVMALVEGVLDGYLVAAMVLPQLVSVLANLIRRHPMVERPTTFGRLQFVAVVLGFWLALLGVTSRKDSLVAAGRGLLYAEVAIASGLAVLRAGGAYPR